MHRHSVKPARRRTWEAVIRILDLIVYAAVFVGGVYALVATPASVASELQGWEWLVVVWSALLIFGGALGFAGRLSRVWMLEPPACVSAMFGILIYLVLIGKFALTSATAAVAVTLVLVAGVAMVRRYGELQIFGEEPGVDEFRLRVAAAIRRRTANAVPHR